MKNILAVLAIIIGLSLFGVSAYIIAQTTEQPTTPQKVVVQEDKYAVGPPEIMEMLELVNNERAKVGVAPLVIDPKLNESAQMKADDMFTYKYFGHENHDGTQGYTYIRKVGATCGVGGENITDNVTEEDNNSMQSVYNWVHSPPHYKAMINPKQVTTGFGVSGTKVVEHFCRTA